MSDITRALYTISTHRNVVAAYYVRSTRNWIVAGISKTAGGAVVVDSDGQIISAHPSKRDALQSQLRAKHDVLDEPDLFGLGL